MEDQEEREGAGKEFEIMGVVNIGNDHLRFD